jgi:adenylate cyclase
VGFLLAVLAARATVDPIKGLRAALTRLGEGDLAVEVPVYDATEVGLLQAGFNRTVAGLQERERMRELFGRHVGEDVARAALARDSVLGGEVREVAALFVDVIGSTALASARDPQEVVRILNGFFSVVIAVVAEHGGFVNKFEGDGALAVFGAPSDLPDPAGAALAAARALAERLDAEVTDCRAAIGVAAGPAVAGNIGAEERYEYTVIGDPVNEAARLCDLAKDLPGRVAASMRAVEASGAEASHWAPGESVVLRGRSEPTGTAIPVGR